MDQVMTMSLDRLRFGSTFTRIPCREEPRPAADRIPSRFGVAFRTRAVVLAILLLALMPGLAAAQREAACAAPPRPVIDLDLARFYADEAGSIIDPAKQAEHDAAVAPLTLFVRTVGDLADKSHTRPSAATRAEAARCALGWLATWAKAGALTGRMASRQAEYQRKWDFGGIALAYLKLKAGAASADRALIEPWLIRLADASRAFFDDPARTRNNHWYWLGLGLAATGHATNSDRHWAMARGIMADAARDIAADGTLPKEMERKSRALFYHVFAMTPLVVMAELAASKGEDWYALGGGALHRLVALSHRGLMDPAGFDARTGVAQERPLNARAGWLQLYDRRFPARLAPPHPVVAEGHRWLGGRVEVLSGVLGRH
jgi:poly(beta-D-mannuronate) lyase